MEFESIAPPGWEEQVRELHESKTLDNVFALAWHLKQQQQQSRSSGAAIPVFEGGLGGNTLVDQLTEAAARIKDSGVAIPDACFRAAAGDNAAINNLLQDEFNGIHIHQEQNW